MYTGVYFLLILVAIAFFVVGLEVLTTYVPQLKGVKAVFKMLLQVVAAAVAVITLVVVTKTRELVADIRGNESNR